MGRSQSFTAVIVGSIVIAAVSTVGDFVWAAWIAQHRAVYGMIHGTLLFCAIGLFLGRLEGRSGAGAVAGALIGALAAGAFYLLTPLVGFSAMFVAWFGVWIALGLLQACLSGFGAADREMAARGAMTAAASGLAFLAISGIWRPFDPRGWDYATHLGAWAFAYFPGFAALLVYKRLTQSR